MNLSIKWIYLTLSMCISVGVIAADNNMSGSDTKSNADQSRAHTAKEGQHQTHYDDAGKESSHTAKHDDAHEKAHVHDHDGDLTAANDHASQYQTADGDSSHANAHAHHHDDDSSQADSHAHHYYQH